MNIDLIQWSSNGRTLMLKTIVQGSEERPGPQRVSSFPLWASLKIWAWIPTSASIVLCMSASTTLLSVEEKTHGRLLAVILAQGSDRGCLTGVMWREKEKNIHCPLPPWKKHRTALIGMCTIHTPYIHTLHRHEDTIPNI